MKIRYGNQDMRLEFSDYGSMFYLVDPKDGEVVKYICGRLNPGADFNQTWLDAAFLEPLEELGVVKRVIRNGDMVRGEITEQLIFGVVLVDIIHPDFNDGGYSSFGDFSRSRLGQQCQYASRYITGRIEGYPNLGEGLRFLNQDSGNYHSIRIHRDDMDEFERRYKEYQPDNGFGMRTEVLEWLIGK